MTIPWAGNESPLLLQGERQSHSTSGVATGFHSVSVCITVSLVADLFDLDQLDENDPFEIDSQAAHLFKHAGLGIDDIHDVWQSDPVFYPAKPPADWLMVAEVHGEILVVPLARSDSNDPTRCRPFGCDIAAKHLADRYLEDR